MHLMKRLKLLGLTTLTAFFGYAQTNNTSWCKTHSYFNEMMANDSNVRINYERTMEFADKYIREEFIPNRGKSNHIYIIPVVFHVIHTGGSENISNATIQNAVNQMNINYRKMRSDTAYVAPPFIQIYPDCEIEFRLAKIDPDGNCTDGITRTYSPLHIEAGDAVKTLVRWPNNKYLNIWTVSSIAISASAYAQFPGGPDSNDGIVCMAGSLGSLTHEAGHHFGLPHTWGPTNDPGCDGTAGSGPCAGVDNCNLEDAIADTPNERGSYGCSNLFRNTCSDSPIPFLSIYGDTIWPADSGEIHENFQNHMSYAGCSVRNFTDGQKARMHAILNSTTNGRNNLWSDSNLIATGTNDGYTCDPVANAEFTMPYEYFCTGMSVSPVNYSYGSSVMSFMWDFGPNATVTDNTFPEPNVTYNTTGFFDVTLTASNTGGSKSITKERISKVLSGEPIEPFHETFASSTFPINDPNDFSKNWIIHTLADDVPTWERNFDASTDGSASIKLNLKQTTGVHRLFSPMLDLTQGTCNELTFDVAYAGRTALTLDRLKVRASTTCGRTWPQSRVLLDVTQQDIAPNNLMITGDYIPTASDWKTHTLDLSDLAGEENVLFLFEVETSNGNALYLDNVTFGCSSRSIAAVAEEHALEVVIMPNPSDGQGQLIIQGAEGTAFITIHSLEGKEIAKTVTNVAAKGTRVNVKDITSSTLAEGVYVVTITTNATSVTKQMIIQ